MEIEFFLLNYQRIKSESTRKMYRIYLARFADFLHNNSLRLEDVCPSHIRRFIAIVKNLRNYRTGEQGISDTTVQLHLAAISSYYSWLQERGGNVQNPLREMKFRREQEPRKVSPVCSSVADSMCSSDIDELNTALACVGRSSGVRVSEMSGMNKEDIEVVKFPGREPLRYHRCYRKRKEEASGCYQLVCLAGSRCLSQEKRRGFQSCSLRFKPRTYQHTKYPTAFKISRHVSRRRSCTRASAPAQLYDGKHSGRRT